MTEQCDTAHEDFEKAVCEGRLSNFVEELNHSRRSFEVKIAAFVVTMCAIGLFFALICGNYMNQQIKLDDFLYFVLFFCSVLLTTTILIALFVGFMENRYKYSNFLAAQLNILLQHPDRDSDEFKRAFDLFSILSTNGQHDESCIVRKARRYIAVFNNTQPSICQRVVLV